MMTPYSMETTEAKAHQTQTPASLICRVCGRICRVRRVRNQIELAASYRSYFGTSLPDELVGKYFTEPNAEHECPNCRIRWYGPARLGESDYYEVLGRIFPWYYSGDTWDKRIALSHLVEIGLSTVVEIGCGSGAFLQAMKDRGITGIGIDINEQAVQEAQTRGLQASLPSAQSIRRCDALCLFQTIEHVEDPVEFLKEYLALYSPRGVLLSAPAFCSLLGYTSDPLVWPPHHRSAWSERGFAALARKVGLRLQQYWYEPLSFDRFISTQSREPNGRIPELPRFRNGRIGRLGFWMARTMGFNWAVRAHSVLGWLA